ELARAEFHAMEVELIGCRQALVDMKASISWKLTAPLRALKRRRR
ncbi:MAG: hypothetical protein QOE60_1306, partial [Thermoleophilaceae bacterium]|nr:hypothetical protein [Thermoleophilaceae bacterium]